VFLPLDGHGPLRSQLSRALKTAVLDGRLRTGERLPSSRDLARELGLSRNTVLGAYDELAAEGFLLGRVGAGSFVAAIEPQLPRRQASPPPSPPSAYARRAMLACARPLGGGQHKDLRYNLQYGVPLTNAALTTAWRRELARAAEYADVDYPDARGDLQLREAVCEYLARRRGVAAHADDVLIVSGTQEAFALTAQVLLDPGDKVLLEEPHYPAPWQVYRAHGARVDAVAVDDDGLVCEHLPTRAPPKLVCVTPSHQFPLGAVMSLPRRLALLAYAKAHGCWILEDDYDGEFRYGAAPLAALRALDRDDRTLYVGTFSKTLFPSLRLGYLVLPPALREPFRLAKRLATFGCPAIEQRALAGFIRNGGFERHLRRAAVVLRARRAALTEGLAEHAGAHVDVLDSHAGMHLVAWLRDHDEARCEALIARARGKGLGLYPIGPYYLRPPRQAGLLLGYAGLPAAEITVAMRLFGECLRGG